MPRLSRDSLLRATDLTEREVELPSIGGSVLVRSLPAAYSNQAQSEALELINDARGNQSAHINTAKLEELQVLHGLVDPKLGSVEEARMFSQQCGPAWHEIVRVIDEISGIDKEAIDKANAAFQAGGQGEAEAEGRSAVEDEPGAGSGGPTVSA